MDAEPIGGPLGRFLADSVDLGVAGGHSVQVTVALHDSARPAALIEWAKQRGLSVRWRTGDNFAYVEGVAQDFGRAFEVSVHDYRSPDGQLFYASTQQPEVPASLRGEVAELGRVLSYNPMHRA